MKARVFGGRALVVIVLALTTPRSAPGTQATARLAVEQAIGRARVIVLQARATQGGVFAVTVPASRWVSANTLLDGRRGALYREGSQLFGLIPIAVDAESGYHSLAVFFPGGRRLGARGSVTVDVAPLDAPTRTRTLSPPELRQAETSVLDARSLLSAIRTREKTLFQPPPLSPPVNQAVGFPFGGREDFGVPMGPSKDGLVGEQHRGIDYYVAPGTPVSAPGQGVVVLARSLGFSGQTIAISHGQGLVSVLSHLGELRVREGQTVSRSTVIAVSGSSGLGARGLPPHVCFATYLHSLNVNPEAILDTTLRR